MNWVLVMTAVLCASAPGQTRNGIYRGKPVTYQVIDGLAVAEGDIVLGEPGDVASSDRMAAPAKGRAATAVIPRDRYLWPNGLIPYVIDAPMSNRDQILEAIQHWSDNTPVRFVERTSEANFIHFRNNNGTACSSNVGMQMGEQFINLPSFCTAVSIIHELGHAVGFWHEHSRKDRDRFLRLYPENIAKSLVHNYGAHVSDGADLGFFDFSSIMIYGRDSDARDSQLITMETRPPGIPLRVSSTGLSAEEIAIVNQWYERPSGNTVIQTYPAGFEVMIDGVVWTAPKSFDWAIGSTHNVSAARVQNDGNATRYIFGRWSDDRERSHNITVSAGASVLTAAYSRQFRFMADASPASGSVSVTPESVDGYYPDGATITVAATPNAGKYFFNWGGNPISVAIGGVHGAGLSPATFKVTTEGLRYTALFATSPVYTVTANPPRARVTVDGITYMPPRSFQWTPESSHTVSIAQNTTYGSGNCRYTFAGWSDGGERVHTVKASAEGGIFTAEISKQCQLTASVYPDPTAGTLTISPPSPASDGYYDTGSQVQITANPASAYKLANWTGDLSGPGESRIIAMNDEMIVQANFSRPQFIPYYSVVHAAGQQPGDISPGQLVTIYGKDTGFDAGMIPSGQQVTFDGIPAPILSASADQVLTIAPYALAGRSVTTMRLDSRSNGAGVILGVAEAAPAIFTADGSGLGQAKAGNEDGSENSSSNPASPGSVISIWATGLGLADPAITDGAVVGDTAPKPILPINAEIDGRAAEVLSAGGIKGEGAGRMRIDVRLPATVSPGTVPVTLLVNLHPSPPGVTISVR